MSRQGSQNTFVAPTEILNVLSEVSQEPLCLLSYETDPHGRADFRCDWLNAACAELLGTTQEALLGTSFLDLLPNGGQLYDVLCDAAHSGQPVDGELDVRPTVAPVTRISYRIVPSPNGLVLSFADQTVVREAEERAAWLERLLITEVELSGLGGAILRPKFDANGTMYDFDIDYINEHGRRLMNMHVPSGGRSLGEQFGASDALSQLIENLTEAVGSRSPRVFEIQIGTEARNTEWMRFLVVPLGDVVLVHGDDISTHRAADYALAESELRYRSLFRTANEGIAIVDVNGLIVEANDAFAQGSGWTHSELNGKSIADLVVADDRHHVYHDTGETSGRQRRRVRVNRRNGEPRWLSVSTAALEDAHGAVMGYLVMALDIDGQVQSELALQASEARYRAIVEHADVLIALTDAEGTVVFVNNLVEQTMGRSKEALIGRPAISFYVPEERDSVERGFLRLSDATDAVTESRATLLHADGHGIPMLGSAVALRDDHGQFSGVVIVGQNMSDVIRQENARIDLAAALAVAEQNERERLAGDLHDGPVQTLAALSLRLGAALREENIDRRVLLHAESTVAATISELRLLLFQLTLPDLQAERLGQCLFDRGRRLLGPSVEVVLYDQIRSNVDTGATQILFRIAQEALANAAKHAGATTLTISLSETKNDIIVEIDDDGIGGDPEQFSRHSAGHLGIRSMTERAQNLGGRCEIMSSPGHGTSVFIRIPRNAMVPIDPFYV